MHPRRSAFVRARICYALSLGIQETVRVYGKQLMLRDALALRSHPRLDKNEVEFLYWNSPVLYMEPADQEGNTVRVVTVNSLRFDTPFYRTVSSTDTVILACPAIEPIRATLTLPTLYERNLRFSFYGSPAEIDMEFLHVDVQYRYPGNNSEAAESSWVFSMKDVRLKSSVKIQEMSAYMSYMDELRQMTIRAFLRLRFVEEYEGDDDVFRIDGLPYFKSGHVLSLQVDKTIAWQWYEMAYYGAFSTNQWVCIHIAPDRLIVTTPFDDYTSVPQNRISTNARIVEDVEQFRSWVASGQIKIVNRTIGQFEA